MLSLVPHTARLPRLPSISRRAQTFGGTPPSSNYSADFANRTDNPLNDGWVHGGSTGLDWSNVRAGQDTNGGNNAWVAYGTMTGAGTNGNVYDDSIAHLTGFPADHRVSVTIHKNSPPAGDNYEVELLLRFQITAHSARGYEILINQKNAYDIQIMRWNGALNGGTGNTDYTQLTTVTGVLPNDGDVFKAQVVGKLLNLWLNATHLLTDFDLDANKGAGAYYSDGQPGIGFYGSIGTDIRFAADSVLIEAL